MSSSRGRVWSGGLERSGIGQRRTVVSTLPDEGVEIDRESSARGGIVIAGLRMLRFETQTNR